MTKRILLIDDSRTQLHTLKFMLQKAGYEVIATANSLEGIHIAENTPLDLVISDIMMPKINGYQLCRLLKNDTKTKHLPIILLTVLNKKIDKFWGLSAGAESFLVKEANIDKLLVEVEKLTSSSQSSLNEIKESIVKQGLDEDNYQNKLTQILDQSLIESTIMNEFRTLSEFLNDRSSLLNRLFPLFDSILDYDIAGIFFNNVDVKTKKFLHFDIGYKNISEEQLEKISLFFYQSIFPKEDNHILNKAKVFQCKPKKDMEDREIPESFKTVKILPIFDNEKVLGGLYLLSEKKQEERNSRVLEIVLNELKLLMNINWLHSKTHYLTIIDHLTNLYNRRHFNDTLTREFLRSKRYQSDLSLALMDIDDFKFVNDTYGHQFGDKVLSKIAKVIDSHLRKTDFIFRYGGEEIVIMLPETDMENAHIPLERIRKKIEETKVNFDDNTSVGVTMSIGLSQISKNNEHEEDMLEEADKALYQAKHRGKNQIVVYS